ncbi:MAG: tetratricopeptide repeat protein [Leptolyngbyaceae bacterium]|nr:tetratricopeptide repeat protein [Leptolyngbyaceae bacterium]
MVKFLRSIWSGSVQPLGGHYKVIQQLGAGGFGHTFLAQDLHLPGQPICVVKQLKPQASSDRELQVARRLFDTEAQVLYQLGNHPNIPRLLAHFEDNGEFYLVQELIEGQDLAAEMGTGVPWSDTQVVTFLGDVLSTLAFVHQNRVIHRDLKPPNLIRRQSDQRIVLIDFGAVKQASTQMIAAETGVSHTISIGTQGYMANEQIAGMPQFSSDIYAVGVMGIQVLTGRHPRTLTPDPRTGELDWQGYASQTHPDLVAVLERMVRYDFRTRYATAADALEAIQALPAALIAAIPPALNHGILPNAEHRPSVAPRSSVPPATLPPEATDPSNLTLPPTDAEAASKTLPESATVTGPTVPVLGQPVRPPQAAPSRPVAASRPSMATEVISQLLPRSVGSPWPKTNPLGLSQTSTPAMPKLAVSAVAIAGVLGLGLWLGRVGGPELGESSPPLASVNPSGDDRSTSPTDSSPNPSDTAPDPSPTNHSDPGLSGVSETPATTPESATDTNANTNANTNASGSPDTGSASSTPPTRNPESTPPPPVSVDQDLQQAEALQASGQYEEAIALYDSIIAQAPDTLMAHVGQCYSLNQIQRYSRALAACDQALTLDPNHPRALWSKGHAIEQKGDPSTALQLYDAALQADPGFSEAWNNRGTALLALGRNQEAVDAFDQAIALNATFAAAWSNRGAALWSLRQFPQAIDSVERALEIRPDYPEANQLRQEMRRRLGS